ncbi:hypothetical protein WT60_24240 [Burkholderia sp. MSMB617WGS]|nr:hypothetical protein WT60_24240 [Burkholderia sp. MSMB617WGS]
MTCVNRRAGAARSESKPASADASAAAIIGKWIATASPGACIRPVPMRGPRRIDADAHRRGGRRGRREIAA